MFSVDEALLLKSDTYEVEMDEDFRVKNSSNLACLLERAGVEEEVSDILALFIESSRFKMGPFSFLFLFWGFMRSLTFFGSSFSS